ncbi:MAG: class I SAM-dependent methyltransferase, partial [Oscillospiraceae bacterium]
SRNQTALPYWKYDDTYKATIIGDLAAEESEIIDAVSSISKQQFKQDDVLNIVSGDTNNHTFDPANLQNIYTSFILCAVCKRLDIPYKFELQTKINCDKIITLDNISVIGTLATGQASQILRKIERSIYNANKLQRNGQRHELRGSIGQPHSRAEQASKLQLEHENTGNGGLGFKRERLSETADEQQWRNADQNISGRYDPDIRFKFGNRGLADDIHGTELQQSLSDIIPSISERISPRAMEPASEERRFEPVSLTNDGGNEREGTLIDSTNRPLHSQRNIVKSDVGNISSNDWTVADRGRRRADGIRNRPGQPISGRPDLDTGERAVGRISTEGPTEQKIDLIASKDTSPMQGAVSFFVPEKLNFVLESNTVPSSFAPKSRFANNIDAIILLKKIEEENRFANAIEQKDLNKYAGWGGLPQAFDSQNSSWQNEYKQLVQLLNPDEYEAARASVNNAHYTSGEIIRAMYKSLDGFGFDGGNILEPGMGIGNFFGALPAKMTSSKLYGVEIDSVSGRIARQLYQNADIQIAGFEESCTPDNFFDAAISNVPFGSYKIADKKYDK